MEIKKINIDSLFIRLDSLLKLVGASVTGGQAKNAIINSLVKVNGNTCTMRGKKLYSGDRVEFNGVIYEVCGN